MKVMDNKLFSVEPKNGKLEPGENVTITFTYHHVMAGTDRLPVLFKLTRGREILVRTVYFLSFYPIRPYCYGDSIGSRQSYVCILSLKFLKNYLYSNP